MHETHKPLRMVVGNYYALAVTCTCGWRGPARHLADPHAVQLLADDEDWHDDMIARGPSWATSK